MRDILLLTGLVLVILVVGYFAKIPRPGQPSNNPPPPPPDLTTQEVTFTAPDGYKLSATYYPAKTAARSPAIILVHQSSGSRHDFDTFIPVLQDNDYSILAYDIRGFGQSQNGPAQVSDYPKDVSGAIKFLEGQGGVNADKIAIIGASVGANVAFVASGSEVKIKASVALSPASITGSSPLSGAAIPNFSPHNIFIASDENERAQADELFAASQQIKSQKVYPGGGHGVELLKNDQVQKDILDFLQNLLK